MVARILLFLFIGIVVMGVILWVINSGPAKTVAGAQSQPHLLSSLTYFSLPKLFSLQLPWAQYRPTIEGPDISKYIGGMTAEDIQNSYADTALYPHHPQINQAKTFGTPSPHRSSISLQQGDATQTDPAREYIRIVNSSDTTRGVNMSGWSLQSAVSGARYYLPGAASVFVSGVVNSLGEITLSPGGSVIVVSGFSPVGASFHENICSGYLGTLQRFYPTLGTFSCPSPSDALLGTPENLRAYGSSCLDYVQELSSCEFPTDIPSTLSPTCQSFVANTFTYNGCVHMYRDTASFLRGSWRVYLNSQFELWDNRHDVIRLLDDQGRIVDAVTY